jgi:hypothetical protein
MKILYAVLSILSYLGAAACPSAAQVNIITNRYDNSRTGSNLQESSLTASNIDSTHFGFLYSYTIDGSIYAQPLYVAGLSIPGQGVHNVLFVATMNDKLYAFDADFNSAPLWSRDFTNPTAGVTPVPITDIVGSNSLNIVGNVGIESTPAVDLSTNTMYVVVRTKENGAYVQRLHAVDITTGLDKNGSGVTIQASVTGSASDAVNNVVSFNPKMQQQRTALVLVNGFVLIAWGSHEDDQPYHGWVMAYAAGTLTRQGVFSPRRMVTKEASGSRGGSRSRFIGGSLLSGRKWRLGWSYRVFR